MSTALRSYLLSAASSRPPSPGLFAALGFGLGAIGMGWVGYARRTAPGGARLGAAAAMAIGLVGLVLGGARVALVLLAVGKIDAMVG